MKKLVVLASLLTISSAVLPVSLPTVSLPSCPACITNASARVDSVIKNNPYYAMIFAAVVAVVATKVVDAYVANQEDEEYDF